MALGGKSNGSDRPTLANQPIKPTSAAGTGEWLRVTYEWDVANNDHNMVVCKLTPPDTTSVCSTNGEDLNDSIADFTASGGIDVIVGDFTNFNTTQINIDNLTVSKDAGYD